MVIKMRYPSGINKRKKSISFNNRGMSLESDLNETNNYYLSHNIAVIYKKPTPITIAKVNYPSRAEAVIKEAYFKTPSTTDYNGIYQGKYIDFEAKETKLDYFPLANIHVHQIKHLERIIQHGGIGFIIVRFTKYERYFLLKAQCLLDFIEKNTRKSIPISYFEKNGFEIKLQYCPRLDYLHIVDQIYFKGDVSK